MTHDATPSPTKPGGRRAWLLRYPITTAVLFSLVGSYPLFMAGAYAVRFQEDLGASKSQFGLAAAAYFATATVGSFQLGRLVDRFGTRLGGSVAAVGASVASIMVGTVTTTWWMLALALGVTGFSNTAGQLAGNRILAGSVGLERQGLGFGAKQAAVPLGGVIAGVVVAILGPDFPWQTTYLAYAAIALGVVVVAPEFGAASPEEMSRSRGVGADFPSLLALAIAGALMGSTGNALAVLVVDAFETAGFEPSVAAAVLAGGSLAAVAGRVLIGWIVDRRGTNGYTELVGVLVFGVIGFTALAFAGGNVPLLTVGVGFGFAAGWGWPAIVYFVTVRASTAPPATATGFVLTGVFFGAIVGPPLLAWIAEQVAYQASWVTAAVMSALAIIGVVVSRRLSLVEGG